MTLADYMEQHGLTDAVVAAAVGVDRSTITRLRRRVGSPKPQLATAISKWSRGAVSLYDLYDADKEKPPALGAGGNASQP